MNKTCRVLVVGMGTPGVKQRWGETPSSPESSLKGRMKPGFERTLTPPVLKLDSTESRRTK
jgi:hypothetical protein